MSIERELLKRFMIELTTEADVVSLFNDIKECLSLPEQKPEEGVYQKLLRIEDGVEVEILPSELWQDGYEAGKRSVLLSKQPEQHGTQYLLDQVARLTAENAMLKEKWSTSKSEQEPVAWMWDEMFCEDWTTVSSVIKPSKSKYVDNVRPLYLTPPTREPLSTKQAEDLWETTFKSAVPYYIFDEICTAIEQYHGIGGGE